MSASILSARLLSCRAGSNLRLRHLLAQLMKPEQQHFHIGEQRYTPTICLLCAVGQSAVRDTVRRTPSLP